MWQQSPVMNLQLWYKQCCNACPSDRFVLACLQVAQASQEAAEPGDEIAALVQTMGTDTASLTTFKEGDRVLVTEGDLKNLDGVVVSVNDEGKLMVKASLAELAGNAPLTIDAQHVVKFFQVCSPSGVIH